MSFSDYLLGMVRLAGIVVPAVVAARSARQVLIATASRPWRALIDLVLTLSLVTVSSEALGAFGELRTGPLIASLAVVAAGAGLVARRHRRPTPAPGPSQGRRLVERVAVAGTTALVAAMWSTWVANAVDLGIGDSDSNWYHLPFAARFAQTGWTSHAQFVNAEPLVTYYPANGSLVHAVGMLAFHTDFLSIFLNVALVPAALLAGWCIGEGSGQGPASLVGVAVTLTVPVIASSQAGSANDDLLATFGLLAAAAFAIHPDLRAGGSWRVGAVLAGLAAGLAIGTKLTVLLAVAVLLFGAVVAAGRGRRWAVLWRAGLATAVTGGFWYGRDLVLVGNPVPGLDLHLGSLSLPRPAVPSVDGFGSTLSQHISDAALWRHVFLPGAGRAFGVAWFVVVGLTVVGLVAAVGARRHAVIGVAGLAALVAYAFTPGSAYGSDALAAPGATEAVTNLFAYNLRYLLPVLALGLTVLPVAVAHRRSGALAVLGGFGAVLVATQLGGPGTSAWASGHAPVAIAVGLAVLAAMLLPVRRRAAQHLRGWRPRPVVVAGAATVAVVAVAWPVQVRYRSHRDAGSPLAQWAATVPGARIAYAGFDLSYDLYGPRLENWVQYLGQRGPHGSFGPIGSCLAWRQALRQGGYDYLVVPQDLPTTTLGYDLAVWRLGLPGGQPPDVAPQTIWSRTDSELQVVTTGQGAVVYRVTGPANTSGCGP